MRRAPVRILAYHSLTARAGDPLGVSPSAFRRQTEWLAENGWRCLSLREWVEHLENGTRPSDRSVVLTFDDGYADNLEFAAPVLGDLGWTAILFAITDAMDDGRLREHGRVLPPEDRAGSRRSISWKEAEMWCRLGLTIGSHTRTHRALTRLRPLDRDDELRRSASLLRDRLGITDLYICYPYGSVDVHVVEAARAAGYRGGVCTPHAAGIPDSPWTVHRVGIYGHDDMSRFRFKLGSVFPILRSARFGIRRTRFLGSMAPPRSHPRVLHLTSSSGLGGVERMLSRLLGEMEAMGFRGEVLPLEPGGPAVSHLRSHGVTVRAVPGGGPVAQWTGLRSLVRDRRYGVLHAYGTRAIVLARLVSMSLGAGRPKVVAGINSVNHGRGLLRKALDRWTRRFNDLYVADCRAAASAATARLGIAPEEVRVVPMGLEKESVGPVHSRAETRAALGLTETDRVLICVANLRPMKGHLVLLRAFERVLERWPRSRLLLVGIDHMGGRLQREADRRFEADQVRFLGLREDVDDLLVASDLFVIASEWEGLCVANLEAMRVGLPIVATSVGGIPEAVRHGIEGLLVPPRNPEALADAIEGLLGDRETARRMGRAARERVLKEYTIDRMSGQLAAIYSDLIGLDGSNLSEGEGREAA